MFELYNPFSPHIYNKCQLWIHCCESQVVFWDCIPKFHNSFLFNCIVILEVMWKWYAWLYKQSKSFKHIAYRPF